MCLSNPRNMFAASFLLCLVLLMSHVSALAHNVSQPCSDAVHSTINCHSMLLSEERSGVYLDARQLDLVCVPECSVSLLAYRKSLTASCGASDTIETPEGEVYPATYVADVIAHAFNIVCRVDKDTGEYCEVILTNWLTEETSSSEAENLACSDCTLGLLQLSLNSSLGYSDEQGKRFAAITSGCSATGYDYMKPTPLAISTESSPCTDLGPMPTPSFGATNIEVSTTTRSIAYAPSSTLGATSEASSGSKTGSTSTSSMTSSTTSSITSSSTLPPKPTTSSSGAKRGEEMNNLSLCVFIVISVAWYVKLGRL